jgi:hypothetical protein
MKAECAESSAAGRTDERSMLVTRAECLRRHLAVNASVVPMIDAPPNHHHGTQGCRSVQGDAATALRRITRRAPGKVST